MRMKGSRPGRSRAGRLGVSFLVLLTASAPLLAGAFPRFEDYPAEPYRGAIHKPKWIHQGDSGEPRDALDKLVIDTEINFAGKYFICVHSCGTGCRYYTLTDLSTGRDSDLLDMFATAEPTPKTRDGRDYLTELFSRPDSRMLVAQYHVSMYTSKEECRERLFLFDGGRLKPLTATRRACGKY